MHIAGARGKGEVGGDIASKEVVQVLREEAPSGPVYLGEEPPDPVLLHRPAHPNALKLEICFCARVLLSALLGVLE